MSRYLLLGLLMVATLGAVLLLPAPAQANVFQDEAIYVDPNNHARQTADQWRSEGRIAGAKQLEKIARTPTSQWFSRLNSTAHKKYVDKATAAGKLPVLTLYAIPYRDCGSYSAGGLAASNYRTFIDQVAAGIGDRKAVVVLEPDALGLMRCLSAELQQERLGLLRYAVRKLKSNPRTHVYIDTSMWISVSTAVDRLQAAGIARADGFSLNVSGFYYTSDVIAKGRQISAGVGGKHFVIDTSRNGNGLYTGGTHSGDCPEWANPPGRALGPRAGSPTAKPLVDAYLWIKYPGESDASCGRYPSAGTWMPEYALGLARRASWTL